MKGNSNYTGAAGKISDHFSPTEGDKTTGAGNLFQYFTTGTVNAPILRRRWPCPGSNP